MKYLKKRKLFIIPLLIFLPYLSVESSNPIAADCRYNGIQLYGKVRVVQSSADIDVKIVDHFEDLKVRTVENFANRCGEWIFVESFPDFTVRFVNHFEDIKIRYVDHFPGVR